MEDKERVGRWRIKKWWDIGGLRKGGALEDKERVGHREDKERVGLWRIKKGWGIRG